MTDLTEQLYAGTLPTGHYYFNNCVETYIVLYKNINSKHLILQEPEGLKVLCKVPSYEEWKAQQNYEEHQKKCISIYENKEKQHTDDAIAYNELKESFDLIKSSLYSMTKVWNSTREDCKTLAQKLLQVKPELREWLEVNYGEYL